MPRDRHHTESVKIAAKAAWNTSVFGLTGTWPSTFRLLQLQVIMKAVAVNTCRRKGEINVVHHILFHGVATRDDVRGTNSPTHFLGDSLAHRVNIARSGLISPNVIKPCNSLFVNGPVAEILNAFPGITLLSANIIKLVRLWYEPGDFSYVESVPPDVSGKYFTDEYVIGHFPDDQLLHKNKVDYHEVIITNSSRCAALGGKVSTIEFSIPDGIGPSHFKYPEGLLDKVGAIWGSSPIFRQDVFDAIQSYFDWTFFAAVELSI